VDDGDLLDRAALRALAVFGRMGFAPELADAGAAESDMSQERMIRLRACPVRELARAHPEVGCGVHLGLLQGLLADPSISAHLEPFVEPDLCLARLTVD
jgi:predicted ArsR family transcriptional regulator